MHFSLYLENGLSVYFTIDKASEKIQIAFFELCKIDSLQEFKFTKLRSLIVIDTGVKWARDN